jgi:hypothetical protein
MNAGRPDDRADTEITAVSYIDATGAYEHDASRRAASNRLSRAGSRGRQPDADGFRSDVDAADPGAETCPEQRRETGELRGVGGDDEDIGHPEG